MAAQTKSFSQWTGSLGNYGFADVLPVAIALGLTYYTLIYLYRVTFHPLAKFPGPKIAGATFWYEFYFDLWPHKYQYMWKIEELHRQYGPIVRINPNHLHIHDPAFLDEIYTGNNRKRDRDSWFMHASPKGTMGWSLLQTMGHELHRRRRTALNPFFSKRNIQQLEPMILEKIDRLSNRLSLACQKGDIVNLSYATAALTMDVISSYALGADVGNLKRDDWGKDWLDAFRMVGQIRPVGRQFKWFVNGLANYLPLKLVEWFNPQEAFVLRKLNFPMESIKAAIRDRESDGPSGDKMATNTKTIFQDILDSPLLPPSEKSAGRLNAEAGVVLGAGTETTARTLSITMYHLFNNPSALARLRSDLATVAPAGRAMDVSVADLEAIPYLNAVVSEGLRLAHGISSRQPRIATEEDLQYGEWLIPAGTPVMQSLYLHHMNPDIFFNPTKFEPQRWLDNPKLKPQYLLAFGRGSRSCIGMNLANAELYLALAHMFRRFDFELFDTIQERDVDVTNDCFIGTSDLKSPGIRVRVVREIAA